MHRIHHRHCLPHLLAALILATTAATPALAALNLTLNQVTDISALNFGGVGGLAYDPVSGLLWITDAGGSLTSPGPGQTNDVALINPLTASVTTLFDASSGNVFLGPDAVAWNGATSELFLFSAFVDRTAGVTTAAGVSVRTLTIDPRQYAGAAFNPGGELWVADREQQTFNPDYLVQLDASTGMPLPATPMTRVKITGASFNPNLSALVFDPFTGNPIAYDTDQQVLLEIDLGTGMVLSETAVGSFFTDIGVPGGLAFNSTGDVLFIGTGVGISHPTGVVENLAVLNRSTASMVPLPAAGWLLLGAVLPLFSTRRRRA